MRFAIWAAVSTAPQATPDKLSLSKQERKCRSAGQGKGWVESCGPYIVPGASRSFYVDLSLAESEIPSLHTMLEDARNDCFDVLMIYTYDRLGDLVDMIAQALRFYGKQIYSVSQPVEPQAPDQYDPFQTEAEAIMRDAARITQRFRINDLQRKLRDAIPARVDRGLTPLRVPFGYSWVGKKVPPVPVSEECTLILQLKDMFFEGKGINTLARFATKSGVRPPNGGDKWDASSVKYILSNLYYAGFVSVNRSKVNRDPRRKNQKKQIKQPRSKWKIGRGNHVPLWDEETHIAIVGELERRREMNQRYIVRYPISGLLFCAVCGQVLHRQNYGYHPRYRVLACKRGKSHVILRYDKAVKLVAEKFAEKIQSLQRHEPPVLQVDHSKQFQDAIETMGRRRKKIQEGFEGGIYTKPEASERLAEIDSQIADLQYKIERSERAAQWRNEFLKLPDLQSFPKYVIESPRPAFIHRVLVAFIEKIIVFPDHKMQIRWRE